MNNLLGTKFKLVAGYKTSRDVDLAMARGEVGGRAGNNFQSIKASHPDWIRDKNLVFLTQIGLERDPEFPDVPLLTELAKNEEQRSIFKMFSVPIAIGRPFLDDGWRAAGTGRSPPHSVRSDDEGPAVLGRRPEIQPRHQPDRRKPAY